MHKIQRRDAVIVWTIVCENCNQEFEEHLESNNIPYIDIECNSCHHISDTDFSPYEDYN